MSFHDLTFDAMGGEIRLLLGDPLPGSPPAAEASARARTFIEHFATALSRFRADSELSRFNSDPAEVVPASPLLRRAVRAGIWAAEWTGGLVDPTLAGAIAAAGYAASRAGVEPASLAEALAAAPPRRPAGPSPRADWRKIEVDDETGTIRRPPGVAFDTGGIGKGLAADIVAEEIVRAYSRYVVDCAGDVRVGGFAAQLDPFSIHARHPIDREYACIFRVKTGGIATSGMDVRIWRRDDGSFAHHLLDPSSGEPVWSGLVGVTALGRSALEAETLSKHALLSGRETARRLLAERGGMLVHEDGEVEVVGSVDVKLIGRRSASPAADRTPAGTGTTVAA
jgi:thiamine biosynthesis lipoprotein